MDREKVKFLIQSIEVLIEGKPFRMIADQGASISCLNENEVRAKCPEALNRKNLQRGSENKFLKQGISFMECVQIMLSFPMVVYLLLSIMLCGLICSIYTECKQ